MRSYYEEEDKNYHYSFSIGDEFLEYYSNNDYNTGLKLVTECFEQFSKRSDCITSAVLEGLRDGAEEAGDEKATLFFTYLLKQLEILYSNWLRSQA